MVVFVQTYHRAVHPRLILGDKCQIGIRILQYHGEETIAEDEVTLYQQRVVLLQLVLDDRQRIDVVGLVVDGVLGEFYF